MNKLFYTLCLFFLITNSHVFAQPPNDNICNATPLTVAYFGSAPNCGETFPYDNTGANIQAGESQGVCWESTGAAPTVWFSFVAPPNGLVSISTNYPGGSNDDTQLTLLEGTPCPGDDFSMLTEIGCSEDIDNNNYLSAIEFITVTPGNTYYIQLSGFDGQQGTFCIEVATFTSCTTTFPTVCMQTNNTIDVILEPGTWNTTAGYALVFVLVDNAGNINAVSGDEVATGTHFFDAAALPPEGSIYQIHTLNYDTTNVPDPLPMSGQTILDIGAITPGESNLPGGGDSPTDFFANYMCVDVLPVPFVSTPASTVICSGGSTILDVSDINFSGGTFNWTATYGATTGGAGSASGVNFGTAAINETLVNATTAPIDVVYSITPIGTAPENCEGTPVETTVTVNPTPIINTPNIELCSTNATFVDLTVYNTTVNPTSTVSWYLGQPSLPTAPLGNPTFVDLTFVTELWVQVVGGGCVNEAQIPFTILDVSCGVFPWGGSNAAFLTLKNAIWPTIIDAGIPAIQGLGFTPENVNSDNPLLIEASVTCSPIFLLEDGGDIDLTTDLNEFYIQITNITGDSGTTDFSVTASSGPNFLTATFNNTVLQLGPFHLTDGPVSITATENLSSTAGRSAYSGFTELDPVPCPAGLAMCDCTADNFPFNNPGIISASAQHTTSGFYNETSYKYVLVDRTTDIVLSVNNTGLFTNLDNGNYEVFAYNVLDVDEFIFYADPGVTPGNPYAPPFSACFNNCGSSMHTIACSCCGQCGNLGDNDRDCICNNQDPDDDNDGIPDTSDLDPFNPYICQDADQDGCEDCAYGVDGFGPLPDHNSNNDGPDYDNDGICDSSDTDDDNDGVADVQDAAPFDVGSW